jgi:hypothetical protein
MHEFASDVFRPLYELFYVYDLEEFFQCDDRNTKMNFHASRNKNRELHDSLSEHSTTVVNDITGK